MVRRAPRQRGDVEQPTAATVSVVMATYNGAAFIDEQLRSLAAQTVLPSELVVSDDGSTDGTLVHVERFAEVAPFPVLVLRNTEPLGYGENFLRAARLATGDCIALCDQDDVWLPTKLQVALAALAGTGALLHVHRAAVIDEHGHRIGVFRQGIRRQRVHPPLHLPPWSVFYGFSMVFPTWLLTVVDPSERGGHTFEHDGPLSHDLWIYFLAASLGRVMTDDRVLVAYRRHSRNVTPHVLRRGLLAWTPLLGVAAHPGLRRDEIAEHRAALMRRLACTAGQPDLRAAAGRAARHWAGIARHERSRLLLYGTEGVLRRAVRCGGLACRGAYRAHRRGGLGRRLLVKDVLVGVVRLRRGRWARG